jgi:hypothetical protein
VHYALGARLAGGDVPPIVGTALLRLDYLPPTRARPTACAYLQRRQGGTWLTSRTLSHSPTCGAPAG